MVGKKSKSLAFWRNVDYTRYLHSYEFRANENTVCLTYGA